MFGSRWRSAVAILAIAALSGCASYYNAYYVHSVWRPAGAEATHPEIVWLTDRAKSRNFPGGFGYRKGSAPSCGVLTARLPAAREPAGSPDFASVEKQTTFSCGDTPSSLDGLVGELRARASAKHCDRVLLFVHGYNTGFDTAVLRAGQLANDTQFGCVAMAFSWSSLGKRELYVADLENAAAATPLLADFLRAAARAGLHVSLIAHSMGTLLALNAVAKAGCSDATTVDEMVLAAADVGLGDAVEDFPALLRQDLQCVRRITIYASEHDAVLAISRKLHEGDLRLGEAPRRDLAFQTGGAHGVDVIDASDAPADLTGHEYLGLSHEMAADVSLALAGVTAEKRANGFDAYAPTLSVQDEKNGTRYRLRVKWSRRPSWLDEIVRFLIAAVPEVQLPQSESLDAQ